MSAIGIETSYFHRMSLALVYLVYNYNFIFLYHTLYSHNHLTRFFTKFVTIKAQFLKCVVRVGFILTQTLTSHVNECYIFKIDSDNSVFCMKAYCHCIPSMNYPSFIGIPSAGSCKRYLIVCVRLSSNISKIGSVQAKI